MRASRFMRRVIVMQPRRAGHLDTGRAVGNHGLVHVRLTKLSDSRHRLAVVREDGVDEEVELKTRSMLLRDLVHYAVEAEARLERGFYGLLASGVALDRLNDHDDPHPEPQLGTAETLVGPMQSLYNGRFAKEAYVERLYDAAPEVVSEAFVDAVLERLRRLTGHWRATPYSGVMDLPWPPAG